jgi:hypothetical protein
LPIAVLDRFLRRELILWVPGLTLTTVDHSP